MTRKGRGIADVGDITPDKTAGAAESQRDSTGRGRSSGEAVNGEERRVAVKQLSGSGSDEDGVGIIAVYREIRVELMDGVMGGLVNGPKVVGDGDGVLAGIKG